MDEILPTCHDITLHFNMVNPFLETEEDGPYEDALILDEQAVAIPFNGIGEPIVLAMLRHLRVGISSSSWVRWGRRALFYHAHPARVECLPRREA